MPTYTYDGTPPATTWPTLLNPYVKSAQIFNCPSASDSTYGGSGENVDYGLNTLIFEPGAGGVTGASLASIGQPAATVFMTDSNNNVRVNPEGYVTEPAYNTNLSWPQYRHLETTNVAFGDGHAKAMRKGALEVRSAVDGDKTGLTGDDQFTLWNRY